MDEQKSAGPVQADPAAAADQFGAGQYVARVLGGEVYLRAGIAARLEADPLALRAVRVAVSGLSGVERVFTAKRVIRARWSAERSCAGSTTVRLAPREWASSSGPVLWLARDACLEDRAGCIGDPVDRFVL